MTTGWLLVLLLVGVTFNSVYSKRVTEDDDCYGHTPGRNDGKSQR